MHIIGAIKQDSGTIKQDSESAKLDFDRLTGAEISGLSTNNILKLINCFGYDTLFMSNE